MSFWQVYRIVIKRKWVVLASCLLTMLVAGVGSLFLPRSYVARAILLPSERALQRSAVDSTESHQPVMGERESQQANLIALAKTTAVASRALEELKSDAAPWQFMKHISVKPVQQDTSKANIDLIEISCSAKNPDYTVNAANATARAFIATYEDVTHREVVRAINTLKEQANAAKASMDEAADDLAEWRREKNIASLPEQVQSALSEIAPARSSYDQTIAQLAQADGKIASIKAQLSTVKPTKEVVEGETYSPKDSPTGKQLATAEQQYSELSLKYKPAHPKMTALTQLISDLRAKVKKEEAEVYFQRRVISNPVYSSLQDELVSLTIERNALASKASVESRQVSAKAKALSNYSGVDIDLDSYVRKYKSREELYINIMARLNQARISQDMTNERGTIEIVDEARVAEGPIRKGPSNFQLLVAAFIFGLALGIGFVVMADLLDDTIRTPDDAQEWLSLPITGVVPSLPPAGAILPARISEQLPTSPYAEAYRFLAIDLLLRDPATRPQVMMVVTPKPGQGGSTTITNLAISLSQAGRKVILIDADMRRPSLHRLFDLPIEPGLSTALQDGLTVKDICQPVGAGNLQIVSAGPSVDNPWMLLRSEKMERLIANMRGCADFVLIDTPSAMVFADALALCELVDGAVVVIRSHESVNGGELQLKEVLNRASVPIVGVVLNDVAPQSVNSYQFHNRYYADNLGTTLDSEQPSLQSGPVLDLENKDITDDETQSN